jgi:hypothetical protein
MGRRDEPELDELSKLLRRLETMEAAPKHESARQPEPEPQAEYVGALRGAAPAKFSEGGSGPAYDARSYRAHAAQPSTQKTGSSSTSAIIIGAVTAAAVSSVIVAGLVLWTGGSQSDGERRLTFYAPTEPTRATQRPDTGAAASAVRPAIEAVPATNAQALLQRADVYLRTGKPGEARVVLEQAAQLGSGVAALTLGAMYDPGRATQFTNLGLKADPTIARVWYERAKDLGVAEANDRLAELAAR